VLEAAIALSFFSPFVKEEKKGKEKKGMLEM
jgi:hypothetical protein